MNGHYAYTPSIWPSAFTILLLIVLAIYAWRHRGVPGAVPFMIGCLFTILMATGLIMTFIAIDPETKIFWFRFDSTWWLPSATAITCFILEYAWPGRWLTRRNLILLSIVPLLGIFYYYTAGYIIQPAPVFTVGESVKVGLTSVSKILIVYFLVLTLINLIIFTWLFIYSPRHRWPVVLMATSQIVLRIVLLGESYSIATQVFNIPVFALPFLTYAIALFGFRIFDPIPLARHTVIEQLHAGMLVLDLEGRVVSLNPSAERILGVSVGRAKGQQIQELLPVNPYEHLANLDGSEIELNLGSEPDLRHYTLAISQLKDFRDLKIGCLLLLQDVTRQKHDQAQIMEQQRVLATFKEREQLAREMHDSIGQVLGYAGFQLEAASKLVLDGKSDAAVSQLDRLADVFRDSHADVREYILNLRSGLSLHRPFFEALEGYLQGFTSNYDIRTQLDVDKDFDASAIPPEAQMQFFRIVQEALSNARKHGQAHVVQVSLAVDDCTVRMNIQDDGIGFDPTVNPMPGKSHFGLQFMHERAEALGGCLRIESSPGAGTRLVLEVPRKEP